MRAAHRPSFCSCPSSQFLDLSRWLASCTQHLRHLTDRGSSLWTKFILPGRGCTEHSVTRHERVSGSKPTSTDWEPTISRLWARSFCLHYHIIFMTTRREVLSHFLSWEVLECCLRFYDELIHVAASFLHFSYFWGPFHPKILLLGTIGRNSGIDYSWE